MSPTTSPRSRSGVRTYVGGSASALPVPLSSGDVKRTVNGSVRGYSSPQ